MRKVSADYIFPISSEPIKNGVVSIDDDGVIIDISHPSLSTSSALRAPSPREKGNGSNFIEERGVEHYKGIICPGFINTHCHLELSHLKGKVTEQKGITGFISELIPMRNQFSENEIQDAISEAENEMIKNGIVAIGDISNNNSTFNQKAKNNLLYHTFIEVFDLNPERANEVFENATKLKSELSRISHLNTHISIVPHAPYTVSDKLFELIREEAIKNNSIICIHSQESEAENELFETKSGKLFDTFTKMGINLDYISKGLNSIQTIFTKLPLSQKILFVHNTFTSKSDFRFIKSQYSHLTSQIYFCTCPNANLYIENKLPDYNLFIKENTLVTIGTDSLASNWSLSILDEIKTITKYFPEIPLQTMLTWATKNGADFLGFNELGAIEKDKKPGLNLLKNVDGLEITDKTEVIRLV